MATFLLADSTRDEALLSLRTYEKTVIAELEELRRTAISRSTDIETYFFQLAGDQYYSSPPTRP